MEENQFQNQYILAFPQVKHKKRAWLNKIKTKIPYFHFEFSYSSKRLYWWSVTNMQIICSDKSKEAIRFYFISLVQDRWWKTEKKKHFLLNFSRVFFFFNFSIGKQFKQYASDGWKVLNDFFYIFTNYFFIVGMTDCGCHSRGISVPLYNAIGD